MAEKIKKNILASTKEAITKKHQKEWQELRETILEPAIACMDIDKAKLAKELATAIKTIQESERKAHEVDVDIVAANNYVISWLE